MATKRGKAKKKNPCWKGYTAMGDDGQIVMKKKGDKMVPACRPIKDGASIKKPKGTKKENVLFVKTTADESKENGIRVTKAKMMSDKKAIRKEKKGKGSRVRKVTLGS